MPNLIKLSGTLHRARIWQSINQSIANDVDVKINYNTVDFDIGGITDISNSKIIIKKEGYYRMTAFHQITAGSVSAKYIQKIFINGVQVGAGGNAQSITETPSPGVTVTKLLQVDDVVEGYVFQGTASNKALVASQSKVYLEVDKLS